MPRSDCDSTCSMSLTVVVRKRSKIDDDAVRHLVGGEAAVVPDDGDDRNVDIRKDVSRRALDGQRSDAEDEKRQDHEGVGPVERDADDPHVRFDLISRAFAVTSRRVKRLAHHRPYAFLRKRSGGAHIRGGLAPVASVSDRFVGRFGWRAARHVHGRHVPRKPPAAGASCACEAAAARVRVARTRLSASMRPGRCSRPCRSSVAGLRSMGRRGCGGPDAAASSPACVCLPPTIAMGATLPVVASWIDDTRESDDARGSSAWLGWFYAGNIVGAVFGRCAAGFYLLRVHDMAVATWWRLGEHVCGRRWHLPVAARLRGRLDASPRMPAPANPRARQRLLDGHRVVDVVIACLGFARSPAK